MILKNVRITGKDKSPMILLPMVKAVIFPSDLAARDFRLAALQVRDPEIDVSRDRNGKLNLLSLNPRIQKESEAEKKEERAAKDSLAELERNAALSVLGHRLEEIRRKHDGNDKLLSYIDDVRENVLAGIEDFKGGGEEAPSPYDLFGRIEHRFQMGAALTDFTMIKSGALHKSNGGFLVLNALDLLRNIFSYDALKRAIRNREVKIEDVWEQYRLVTTMTMKPEPIPLEVKGQEHEEEKGRKERAE